MPGRTEPIVATGRNERSARKEPPTMPCRFVARHFDTGQPVQITLDGARVAGVTPRPGALSDVPRARDDRAALWVAPAWVDLQVNGYGGIELTTPHLTEEEVEAVLVSQTSRGVARMCPTLTTHAPDTLLHALATIAQAVRRRPRVQEVFAGIHLEGPFLSPEDGPRGAHPKEHIRPLDWKLFAEFQAAADGRIRIVTLAPEWPDADRFIERAVASGVLVAIGHTAADGPTIRRAADAGARLSTHLGNGAHARLPRHPNYLWDQLAEDRLMASLIADGHHLDPATLRVFLRAKTPARCILVSDLAGAAGQAPGRYTTPLGEVEILPEGRIVVAGQRQYLAGAAAPLVKGVETAMRMGGLSFRDAVALASVQPARLLDLPPHGPSPGHRADLVLLRMTPDGGLDVEATYVGGQRVP